MIKILKISGIVVLLVAIAYIIVKTFFMSDGKTNTQFSGFGKMVAPERKDTTSTNKLEVHIDRILINMKKGSFKFMKADMTFQMKNKRDTDALKRNMPAIRDTILRFSSNQDSDILATTKGKDQYNKDLKELIYESYGLEVNNIFFRDFVLAK